MASYKTEKEPVSIWAIAGVVIFFGLTFYSFIIFPSFTQLKKTSPPDVKTPLVVKPPPATQLSPPINPPNIAPPADALAVSPNGIFKCVNDGKVSYTEKPCKAGAVPIKNDFVSIVEATSNTATVIHGANGVYSVVGSVNSQPTEFLIDTGASNTTITGELAYRLGVHTCQTVGQVNTANGSAGICRVTVSNLSFAGFNYSNIDVSVSPNMKGASLIGNDLTSKLRMTQNNGVMTISR